MSFEKFSSVPKESLSRRTDKLTHGFRELHEHPTASSVFENLEQDLLQENFTLASNVELSEIFNTQNLFCRSESFTRAINLLLEKKTITLAYKEDVANMCTISSGSGFRTAMQEGFSGKDVDGMVKVVLTFKGEHLTEHAHIPATNELWKFKPETAKVSLAGSGDIEFSDIEMMSFRFPVHYYPKNLLSESEQESLEEGHIKFIVRHYIPNQKKTLH